ncbi:MAG: prepilin-type N-terminal cleavage/methylation domain-containing protein [Planctomycetia bacterium]|nr:prepilin-type N-terminal cleavage/methylation domain-containing protein [Planctomycetia bacterium]
MFLRYSERSPQRGQSHFRGEDAGWQSRVLRAANIGTVPRDTSRQGLTLIELLIASAVMAMTMAALAALGKAVQVNAAYGDGHGQAVQHARVAIDRITRMAREATASPSFPGFLVLAEVEAGWHFPDTVVIWHPSGSPVDPNGLPRFNELIIYCPNPEDPHQLVEITAPSDTRTVPAVSDLTTWASRIDGIKNASSSQVVMLTDLMRSCPVGTGFRGAVRFESRLRPSAAEWTSYQAGDLDWDDLPWVQGLYGSKTGLRQAWLRIELQLMPGATAIGDDPGGQQAMAFLGSAALYYQMRK